MYAHFVDFAKTFDSVQRSKLCDLLNNHGVSCKMRTLLCNIYENVKSCVRNNHEIWARGSAQVTHHVKLSNVGSCRIVGWVTALGILTPGSF